MAPTTAKDRSPPASPLIQHGGPLPAYPSTMQPPPGVPAAGSAVTRSPPGTPPMAPGSPPSSPRLSPVRPTRQKSFTLTPQWQGVAGQVPGQPASARSLLSGDSAELMLEPAVEDPAVVTTFGGGGVMGVLPPGVMQIAFFPEPEESPSTLLCEDTPDAAATDEADDSSDASVTDSIFSYNTVNSIWGDVPEAPPDAILGIAQAYKACTNPNKVNVCVGAYRDENGKPWVLPSVRAAEHILLDDPTQNKEYLPIDGDKEFIDAALRFAYGEETPQEHLAGIQTLSGTGACRIGGAFLNRFWPKHPIYIPDPTWGNHIAIFKEAGLKVKRYRYYNKASNSLDLEGILQDLQKAPNASIVLLHACAHNPTGCDPTIDEWKQIISLISEKEHIAFFDSAYQGFASGDAEEDSQPFRYAVRQHVPILLAQSFAKNFGLYGERVGTLSVVCGDIDQRERILSELKLIVRSMYSSPPRHGSSIVKTVLAHDDLRASFYGEMASMATRIKSMRYKLVDKLREAGSKHDWSHILKQIGMFAYSGLTESMCQRLTNEYYIFLTMNGRISMAGLNDGNIEYVATAMHAVTEGGALGT